VIDNVENMKRMTLEEIEDQWHSGKHMRSKGFDLDKYDHFGELFSLMDSIIHPVTSYIALKDYKVTRKADLLGRASAELIEVLEHIDHIGDNGTMFSENLKLVSNCSKSPQLLRAFLFFFTNNVKTFQLKQTCPISF
jgi:hypothetical protein